MNVLVRHACRAAVILLAVASSHAQTTTDVLRKDGSDFLNLAGHGFTSPLRWNTTDVLIAGGIVTGTLATSKVDDDVFDIMGRNHTRFNDKLESVFETYGNGLTAVVLTGTMYTSGLLFENSWLRETGVVLGSSLLVATVANTGLKDIVGRARPYANLGHDTFRPFSFKSDFFSFPSGHTVVAFTVSSVLARRIDNMWASIALYAAATMSGVSRLYSRNHWLCDDVFAAALGISVAQTTVSWYERGMKDEESPTAFRFIPTGNGITVVWVF